MIFKYEVKMNNRNNGWSKIERLTDNVFHITSEPGDATHYDYYLIRLDDQSTAFSVANGETEFNLPRILKTWDVKVEVDYEDVPRIEKIYNCNYYAYLECARSIKEIVSRNL